MFHLRPTELQSALQLKVALVQHSAILSVHTSPFHPLLLLGEAPLSPWEKHHSVKPILGTPSAPAGPPHMYIICSGVIFWNKKANSSWASQLAARRLRASGSGPKPAWGLACSASDLAQRSNRPAVNLIKGQRSSGPLGRGEGALALGALAVLLGLDGQHATRLPIGKSFEVSPLAVCKGLTGSRTGTEFIRGVDGLPCGLGSGGTGSVWRKILQPHWCVRLPPQPLPQQPKCP